nr:ABC transporter permease [Micromonospora inyonensis]
MDEEPSEVVDVLSARPTVELLDPNAVDPALAFLIPYAFASVFFVTSLTFGLQIAQSVTEEKQTWIVRILVAAVPVRALLASKVVGGAVLAFGQIALIAVGAYVGASVASAPGDVRCSCRWRSSRSPRWRWCSSAPGSTRGRCSRPAAGPASRPGGRPPVRLRHVPAPPGGVPRRGRARSGQPAVAGSRRRSR